MALTLDTVQKYVDGARVLLEDKLAPFRYPDADLVENLNYAISELVRLRPDLYFKTMRVNGFPLYTTASMDTAVVVDYRYRTAVLNYMIGMTQLRDQEDVSDARASALIQKFVAQIMGVAA